MTLSRLQSEKKPAVENGQCVIKRLRFELGRKANHISIGIVFIFILYYFGRSLLLIFITFFLFFGSAIIIFINRGRKIPVATLMVERFERKNAAFAGCGAFWYMMGSLLLVLFIPDSHEIASAIIALALGDAAATIFGIRNGRHRHFYNSEKTVEGSAAFFIFSLPACILLGWTGAVFAALMAVVESLPLPADDNLTIPAASIIFFEILKVLSHPM